LDEDIIDKLPGDLKKIAELIGVENTMKIVDHWGGSYISIPSCLNLKRDVNIAEACKLYDSGGYTIRNLALRFRVSGRTMATWLKKGQKKTIEPKEGHGVLPRTGDQ